MPVCRLTQDRVAGIAERASTIDERLSSTFVAADGSVGSRAARWCSLVAGADATRLQRRLTWDGVEAADPMRRIERVRFAPGSAVPSWIDTLMESEAERPAVLRALARDDATRLDRTVIPAKPIPFEEILLPFVRAARRRLDGCTSLAEGWSERAITRLERSLLAELSELGCRTLFLEFSIARGRAASPAESTSVYRQFCSTMLDGASSELLDRYAALARLLATRTGFWVAAVREIADRLAADRPELERMFNAGAPLGRVIDVIPRLSDSHHCGRTVHALTFECGQRVVYKPRSMQNERIFGDLAARLSATTRLSLRRPAILEGAEDQYGWVELIDDDSCADDAAIQRYYERAGMVLALAYVLGAADLHHENIIAAGEHPVLIDLEVLASAPLLVEGNDSFDVDRTRQARFETVVRTSLLPQRGATVRRASPAPPPLMGGFMARDPGGADRPRLIDINTDWMSWGVAPVTPPRSRNVPRVGDRLAQPRAHVHDIVIGFRDMYASIEAARPALLAQGGVCDILRHASARLVLRDTQSYHMLLQRGLEPAALEDGADRSLDYEVFRRSAVASSAPPALWPALKHESAQLARHDVPYFAVPVDGTVLCTDDGTRVGQSAEHSGLERLRRRLIGLGDSDRRQQERLIRLSFHAPRASAAARRRSPGRTALTSAEARRESIALAEYVRRLADCDRDGPAWSGLTIDAATKQSTLSDVGPWLGDGRAGIALFVAAVASVGGGETFARLARAAIASSLRHVQGRGAGLMLGRGGVIYAAARCGEWLRDERLLNAAKRAALDDSGNDHTGSLSPDVYAGDAGLLLGVLALDSVRSSPKLIRRAMALGQRLLDARERDPVTERLVWRNGSGAATTGFAHGSSGIAAALGRLYRRTKRREIRAAVVEALAFERALFIPSLGNWLESASQRGHTGAESELWTTWCHGATGIGLGRLSLRRDRVSASLREEIRVAVDTTARRPLGGPDHLCCGTFGCVDLLHAAGRTSEARIAAAGAVDAARARGSFNLPLDDRYAPGLMQGISGIGLSLLRLAHPHRFPPVLLFT